MTDTVSVADKTNADASAIKNALLNNIKPSVLLVALSGNMLLQSRPTLVMQCTGNPDAVGSMRARLASAASLGSAGEMIVGPLAGQLSDTMGRKPFLGFFAAAPVLVWLGVGLRARSPRTRFWLLLVDMFLVRCFFQSFLSMASGAAITDVVAPEDQPRARAMIQSLRACGVVLGSIVGGWLQAKRGPAATYILAFLGGTLASANMACRVPETNQATSLDSGKTQGTLSVKRSTKPFSWKGTVQTLSAIISDSEMRFLVSVVTLQELTHLPQFSDVATMLFRDKLQWGPAVAGRFIAAYGICQFIGNQATSYLVNCLGPDLQASLSHLGITISFLLWGSARSSFAMMTLLMPLTLSFGRGSVVQSKAASRARELGLDNGEAAGAISMLGSFAKICGPHIFMSLYNMTSRSSSKSGSSKRHLPAGMPMFFLALLGVVSEFFYRLALRARSVKCCGC